ncbi:thioesterase II family protein [Herpetosiphon geysericola]|nr:alpha/beta fold hydrolase [Herpetosiphon geysericola]
MKSHLWIEWLRKQPNAALRLFCFHYAGGTAQRAHQWAKQLDQAVELCAIELPGRGKRFMEPAYTNLEQLLNDLIPVIKPLLEEKPFVFFGHSMGALVSYELSRRLHHEHQLRPQMLFVSGHTAPHIPRQSVIHQLPHQQFWDRLLQLNGTPKDILQHPELVELLTPILRADFAVCETFGYSNAIVLDCPMVVYGGLDDPSVAAAELELWRSHTSNACEIKLMPGDHFYLHNPSQHELTKHVNQHIQALVRSVTSLA